MANLQSSGKPAGSPTERPLTKQTAYCYHKIFSNPWENLTAEYLGPLPNGDKILFVVDYYNIFYEVCLMKTITSECTIVAWSDKLFTHGLLRTLKTDR